MINKTTFAHYGKEKEKTHTQVKKQVQNSFN
jgi:hypothetical protein